METKRRIAVNELCAKVARLEKAQIRDKNILQNVTKMGLTDSVVAQQREILLKAIERRDTELEELQIQTANIMEGKLDQELTDTYQKEREKIQAHTKTVGKRKKETRQFEEKKKEAMFGKEQSDSRDERNTRKDAGYYYKVYCRIDETLPDYIRKNLADMPGNKGYIWRGCWYFGLKRPEHNQPIILFEKLQGGVLRIHEVDQTEIRIYEKNGKERKKLVQTTQRRVRMARKG